MPARVFVVEDYARLREMLEELIVRSEGMELCGSVGSGEAALEQIEQAEADVVVVDLSLPGMNGFELLGHIRRRLPELICVILSGHRSAAYAARAREAGAAAYIAKSDASRLEQIIVKVAKGDSPFYAYGVGSD